MSGQPTPCWQHYVRQRQTRRHQDRLLGLGFGIRTVNPGFYSPGIEVYSVSSLYTPSLYGVCVCKSLYVEVNYVQVSSRKTFAYL